MSRLATQKGFTIVELMIATTVFTFVLLICTYGLLEIGRAYYKGVTISRTQEAARGLADDIMEAIQFSQGGEPTLDAANNFYCAGSKGYVFRPGTVRDDTVTGNYAVKTGTVSGGCDGVDHSTVNSSDFHELLSNRMRAVKFEVSKINPAQNIYAISIRVVTGTDEDLVDLDGDGKLESCSSERSASAYCAASEINTIVQRRV